MIAPSEPGQAPCSCMSVSYSSDSLQGGIPPANRAQPGCNCGTLPSCFSFTRDCRDWVKIPWTRLPRALLPSPKCFLLTAHHCERASTLTSSCDWTHRKAFCLLSICRPRYFICPLLVHQVLPVMPSSDPENPTMSNERYCFEDIMMKGIVFAVRPPTYVHHSSS